MASPDKDLGVVDCELTGLQLDETLPAVTVMADTVISAGVPTTVVLAKVESEVEVDEGSCEN